jgi:hypothetical protein
MGQDKGSLQRAGTIAFLLLGLSPTDLTAQPCTAAASACVQWVSLGGAARSMVYATYPLNVTTRSTASWSSFTGAGETRTGRFAAESLRLRWRSASKTRS